MSRTRSSAVFCALCPAQYDIAEIAAKSRVNGEERPWTEVLLRDTRDRPLFSLGRRRQLSEQERAKLVSEEWMPYCPSGHLLPDSLDPVRVIGVIGNQNSSKSHYLAGLIHELLNEQPLRAFDIDVSYVADTGADMDARIEKIYSKREILPNTERGKVHGPFMYRVTRRSRSVEDSFLLVFFDVAGEDCTSLRSQAKFVRYIFDATGIILLLDPDGLPREGHPLESHNPDARLTTRALVDTLSEVIYQVTGKQPRDRDQQLVVAMSKADKLRLPDAIYPPPSLEGQSRRSAKRILRHYSDQCEAEIASLGARGVVEAANNKFGRNGVMYAVVSATGEEPSNGSWVSPQPTGCSIPIAQILLASDGQYY